MRLFTGMPLPGSFREAANALQRSNPAGNGVRWTENQNLHVTSFFIGEVPVTDLPTVKDKIKGLAGTFKPLTLELEKLCLWPHGKPYMIWALFYENEKFTRLYRALEQGLSGHEGRGSVKPHITLARFKDFTDTNKINLADASFPAELVFDHLVLYESRLSSAGPTYYNIGNYQLE